MSIPRRKYRPRAVAQTKITIAVTTAGTKSRCRARKATARIALQTKNARKLTPSHELLGLWIFKDAGAAAYAAPRFDPAAKIRLTNSQSVRAREKGATFEFLVKYLFK